MYVLILSSHLDASFRWKYTDVSEIPTASIIRTMCQVLALEVYDDGGSKHL
jgi:hypothetical protein